MRYTLLDRIVGLPDSRTGRAALVFLMLAGFFMLAFTSSLRKSPVHDEGVHLARGVCIISGGDFRMSIHHPPLMNMLCAIPLYLSGREIKFPDKHPSWAAADKTTFWKVLAAANRNNLSLFITLGRLPVILISMAAGFILYLWAGELYGNRSALPALFLYCTSPTILAHARLITTDMAAAAFILFAMYATWRLYLKPSPLRALAAGIFIGLALLSKYSSVLLVPVFIVALLIFLSDGKFSQNLVEGFSRYTALRPFFRHPLSAVIVLAAGIFLIACVTVWAGYGFETMKITKEMHGLNAIFKLFPEGTSLPLLRYVYGFFVTRNLLASGDNYFFGHLSEQGFRSYYVVMFFLKTPLPVLFLLALAFFKTKFSGRFKFELVFIFLPVFAWFAAASFLNNKNLGIRYVLPAYPFLHLFISSIAREDIKFSKPMKSLTAFMLAWCLASCLWIWPDYLMYFNPLCGGPEKAYRVAVVGEDWGQDMKGLGRFCHDRGIKHIWYNPYGAGMPGLYGIPHQAFTCDRPVSGWVAVHLVDLYRPRSHGCYDWIKKYKPVEKIGYTVYVYFIEN